MKLNTIVSVIIANLKIWYLKITNQNNKILPYKILIQLTDLCNSKCTFCEIWKIKPKNEINLDHIKKFFKSINKNLIWLSLSGGEVTLVKYYYELIDLALKYCPRLKILAFTTNALSINRAYDYAIYAKNKGLDVLVTISLDGDEYTHDKLRGVKGNYEKCTKLFYKLKESGISVNYGITLSDQNYDFINEKYKIYKDKIRAVTFVHSEGIYNKSFKTNDNLIIKSLILIYKNYQIKKIQEIVEKIHIKLSIKFLKNNRKKNIIPCEVMNTSAQIFPNGDVKPCMFMPAFSNIKTNDFVEDYLGSKADLLRKEIKENKCPKCWMNCYSPHSIMQNPIKSILKIFFN